MIDKSNHCSIDFAGNNCGNVVIRDQIKYIHSAVNNNVDHVNIDGLNSSIFVRVVATIDDCRYTTEHGFVPRAAFFFGHFSL
jgi:hypothetical protein